MKGQCKVLPSLRPEEVGLRLLESGEARWELGPLGGGICPSPLWPHRLGAGGPDILTCSLSTLQPPEGAANRQTQKPEGMKAQLVQPGRVSVQAGRRCVETGQLTVSRPEPLCSSGSQPANPTVLPAFTQMPLLS